ncbi:HTH-type transcriptional regulator BetI [Methanimicrococcus hongohii]|uniref:HTH-type transcriptional regulator BetI n=1 Tax=Methanimicrococcus hongohii TaxID=3028295 RepID=A0AA96V0D8_9EURY|nr:TetR family transcriptional regulator [Methanimicrococcus sp. Hf6]WNY22935.1 HTH-type transcriptional regulator BetI [Methanimicrococcus sp. Hf6]
MNSENQENFEEMNQTIDSGNQNSRTFGANERRASQKSVIADYRKEQIFDAAILTLNDVGYLNASLAKIAKQADISPALIPYYFQTKTELIEKLLHILLQKQENYVHEKVAQAQTPLEMLYIYIRAYLTYSEEYKRENDAMMEIIYNGRDENGTPYYKIFGTDETDLLEKIIEAVQRKGGFAETNPTFLAIMINGAVRGYTMDPNADEKQDYETYCDELIETVSKLSGFSKKYTYEPIIQ